VAGALSIVEGFTEGESQPRKGERVVTISPKDLEPNREWGVKGVL